MINYLVVRDPSDSVDDDYCDGPSPAIADLSNKNGLPESVTYICIQPMCTYIILYIILMRIPRRTPRGSGKIHDVTRFYRATLAAEVCGRESADIIQSRFTTRI